MIIPLSTQTNNNQDKSSKGSEAEEYPPQEDSSRVKQLSGTLRSEPLPPKPTSDSSDTLPGDQNNGRDKISAKSDLSLEETSPTLTDSDQPSEDIPSTTPDGRTSTNETLAQAVYLEKLYAMRKKKQPKQVNFRSTMNRMFRCKYCGRGQESKMAFYSHMTRVHGFSNNEVFDLLQTKRKEVGKNFDVDASEIHSEESGSRKDQSIQNERVLEKSPNAMSSKSTEVPGQPLNNDPKVHECDQCGATRKSRISLEKHMKVHRLPFPQTAASGIAARIANLNNPHSQVFSESGEEKKDKLPSETVDSPPVRFETDMGEDIELQADCPDKAVEFSNPSETLKSPEITNDRRADRLRKIAGMITSLLFPLQYLKVKSLT